jgi:CubicO group peptidase (beta-lactamase class C family)
VTLTSSAVRLRRIHAVRRNARSGAARKIVFRAGALVLVASAALAHAGEYVPPRGEWAMLEAADAGFDVAGLAAAVELARQKSIAEPADLRPVLVEHYSAREPGYRVLGPTGTRAGGSGMVLRGGKVVAEWGDVDRPEMVFSVVKSVLATVAGFAFADGRIASLDDPVAGYVPGPWFEGEHNSAITWRHLLEQSSDWRGTLWDVPDWADRPTGATLQDWQNQPLATPGSTYEYNDVRVNLLALSLLNVLREPLPRVLRERIMDPIGASSTWRWHGYENSWVELDGLHVQSVAGGGHFGGGLFISTSDLARFGLLIEREGRWGGKEIVSPAWIRAMTTPSGPRPDYGLLWWLNTDRKPLPAAPASAFWALGFGGNYLYVDREHDLVIVLRWIPDGNGAAVVSAVIDALRR